MVFKMEKVLCLVLLVALSGANAEQMLIRSPAADSVSRIVGGSATTIFNYPFIVQVQYNNQLICGGSPLTSNTVLSAAHCFVDDYGQVTSPTVYSVRAGTTTLNSGGTVIRVSAIEVHQLYNTPVRDNDIAILILASRLTFSSSIQPAYIPAQGYNLPDNVPVVHVGWGRTNPNIAALATTLQHVTVLSINRAVCAARYQWLQNQTNQAYPITENMICAGLLDVGGADACTGDSGGPLIYSDVVIGLTSWGLGCAEPSFPGVNSRVSSYTNWINATVSRYSAASSVTSSLALLLTSLATSVTLVLSKL